MIGTFRKESPLLYRALVFILLPVSLLMAILYYHLVAELPPAEGVLKAPDLKQNVTIIRDSHYVPHISATSDRDGFFALGYLHAQDRLWQMENQRRLAQGRMSEVFGEKHLTNDIYMRTLGLEGVADRNYQNLSEGNKAVLKAYSEGVNSWLNQDRINSLNFTLTGTTPKPWRPQDSLLLLKLLQLGLAKNYAEELRLNALINQLGVEKSAELWPEKANLIKQSDLELAQIRLDSSTSEDKLSWLEQQFSRAKEALGSNAWVVSGKYTQSGAPMLASDPHMELSLPSNWYLASISSDELKVSGATIPGLPVVFMGRNDNVSWGVTALTADVQDLYYERLNPVDDSQYEMDGQWRPLNIREETFHVKADFPHFLKAQKDPVHWKVRTTHRGPIISDVLGIADTPVSLNWVGLREEDNTFSALLSINYAQGLESFERGLKDYSAPAVEFIYADTVGNIARFSAGKVPMRKKGYGIIPVPGWTSEYDWSGFIPFSDLPRQINPDSGFIVAGNSQLHGEDYQYLLSSDWAPGYRVQRISEYLRSGIQSEKFTFDDFREFQGDSLSLQAKELAPWLADLNVEGEDATLALQYISNWDFRISQNSTAAAIYQAWVRHFYRLIVKDDLYGDFHIDASKQFLLDSTLNAINPKFILGVIKQKNSPWCQRQQGDSNSDCEALASEALDSALLELNKFMGSDMEDWSWGQLHDLTLKQDFLQDIDLVNLIFQRTRPNGGDQYTVNVAPWTFSKNKGYQQFFGPTYRQVIDLGNDNDSGFISSTGQSDNVISEHYADFVQKVNNNELVSMSYGQLPTGKKLVLQKN